jgi:hypothetical protein
MSPVKPNSPHRRRDWAVEAIRWVAAAGVLVAFWLILSITLGQAGPVLRFWVAVFCGLITVLGVLDLFLPRMSPWVFDVEGLLGALFTAAFVGIAAAGAFSVASYALEDAGLIAFDSENVDPAGLMEFYAWHLLNAVPGNVVNTLSWGPPYGYHETRVGVLVLAYSLLVAAPLAKYVVKAIKGHPPE